MFRRILVANRGEVASRIVRTCRRLGIESVVVVSTADRDQAWLDEATRVVCIGGPHPRDSYLDAEGLLETARRERCSAIHPGWGFLAENAIFAARAEALGVSFIGPPPAVLALTGDKSRARKVMAARGLPPVPGSDGPVEDLEAARREADRIGWPLMVKAAAGGGGRGLKVVRDPAALEAALLEARAQAAAAFGDDAVYLERFVEGGRHVEFQVLADRYGAAICTGSRECSVQRHHQKLLEEAPAPSLAPATRQEWGARAAAALAAEGYVGAGTVEMILDRDGTLHFLECNARLQVEHPVTEAVTGLDLVEWQLRLAAGAPLALPAARPRGHAIECRINAEDPLSGFRPSPGRVDRLELPVGDGIRVDTHLRRPGTDTIPPHYDSLVCKVVAWGRDREEAVGRLRGALARTRIGGVVTTLPLHRAIVEHPVFVAGSYDLTFLEEHLPALISRARTDAEVYP